MGNFFSGYDAILLFLLIFLAIIFAHVFMYILKEYINSNVPLLSRIKDLRYNYIALLYKEIRTELLAGNNKKTTQKHLQDRYRNGSLPFMLYVSKDLKYLDAIEFVGIIINNSHYLFDYAADPDFNKTKFQDLLNEIAVKDKEEEAKSALRDILKDKSLESVEKAMVWLPTLLTPETFVKDPNNESRKISKTENHFSVMYYLKDTYFDPNNSSQEKFISCLNKLREIYPKMQFASSKSHSSDYTAKMSHNDPRCVEMRNMVQKMIEKSK